MRRSLSHSTTVQFLILLVVCYHFQECNCNNGSDMNVNQRHFNRIHAKQKRLISFSDDGNIRKPRIMRARSVTLLLMLVYNHLVTSQVDKKRRLVSFTDDGEIRLDLDFNVPFVTIPVSKSMQMAKSSLLTLNIGSVVLAGTIMFGAAIALPTILAFFNKKNLIPADNPFSRIYNKSHRSADTILWKYLTDMDNSLMENQVDLASCSQRIICWTVKNAVQNVSKGKGSSVDKIFDGLASSRWIQENLLNEVFSKAVKFGIEGRNCSAIYGSCHLNYDATYYLIRKFFDQLNKG